MRERRYVIGSMLPISVLGVLLALCFSVPGFTRTMDRYNPKAASNSMAEEVRHQLVMLPYYNVFDNLSYQIEPDGTVILSGEVTWPMLKSDAERAVLKVAGEGKVINNIEVLPLSPSDDRIRIALYRRIFGNSQLYRYALQAVPPIHIIVKNGDVTLVGVVANEADKNVAGIVANSVPGIFSVTNNLRVEGKGGRP